MESKKINQLATELTPALDDLTIIGDPTTGISKKITLSQMASLFTGTVEEYANLAAFPLVGVADTIYIALDTNVLYRWNTGTNAYVELSPNIINSLVFSDANGFDGNISLVGSTATLTITTALTTGSVPFIGASGALSQDNANLFFDDTNNRLGINTNAPTTALDVFGSGIIGRINGTSTNNSFLGFASAGTNKWSIGNVQSDHRFRIYSEANTAELVSVLQTGEFGIGIANPTTKFHIDGAASALIANLDANVSVAKSISFRSDNSNRINLEVSGTESGSDAGANFFIRRYSDAGALIDTPLTITRSTGEISLATALSGTSATFSGNMIIGTTSLGADGISLLNSLNYSFSEGSGNSYANIFRQFSSAATVIASGLKRSNTSDFASSLNTSWTRSAIAVGYNNGSIAFFTDAATTVANGTNITVTERMTITNTGATILSATDLTGNRTNPFNVLTITANNPNGPYSNFGGSILFRNQSYFSGVVNSARIRSAIYNDGGGEGSGFIFEVTPTATGALTPAMTIRYNGNVGIGTSTPSDGKLVVSGSDNYITSLSSSNVSGFKMINTSGTSIMAQVSNALVFDHLGIERMRITSGGYTKHSNNGTYSNVNASTNEFNNNAANWILVNRNSNANPNGILIDYTTQPINAGNEYLYCTDNSFATLRASIRSNGGFANFQANDTNLSDERTKKDIIPLESYWDKFKAIEIVKFKYKDQTHDDFNIGVIAQQVEAVAPEFIDIDGWGKPKLDEDGNEIVSDEEPLKSVYTSDLHHATIKVLQEAMAKIESLEKEVELLKLK